MKPNNSEQVIDVSSTEWRWVITLSAVLIALTIIPYFLAFTANVNNGHGGAAQFMGILSNPADGATYLAKIGEGMRGQWLFTLAHTPEQTDGTVLFEFYLLLGHIAALLNLSPLLTFYMARVVASFAMYLALYHLGATIWKRLRTRRLFFGLIAIGSGFGWITLLLSPLMTNLRSIDLYVPESIPFFSTFANPHFPLSICLLALLASVFVGVFRPGYSQTPSVSNGGLTVALITLGLALIQPQAWLPFGMMLVVYLLILTLRARRLPADYQIRWALIAIAPALPVAVYDLALTIANPLYRAWNTQNITLSGSPLNYVFGYGLLLLLAVPGIVRAVRHFEQDGDQLMVVWLISNALLVYIPLNVQRRFSVGIIIPLVYFAVRAIDEYWLPRLKFKQRNPALILMFVLVIPSNVFALLVPLFGIVQPVVGIQTFELLPADFNNTLSWLHDKTTRNSVVLAPPGPSLWIPAYTPARVVYGHPFETVDAAVKLQQVNDWYNAAAQTNPACRDTLIKYHVQFVLDGPADGGTDPKATPYIDTSCVKLLGNPVAVFGSVSIYAVPRYF